MPLLDDTDLQIFHALRSRRNAREADAIAVVDQHNFALGHHGVVDQQIEGADGSCATSPIYKIDPEGLDGEVDVKIRESAAIPPALDDTHAHPWTRERERCTHCEPPPE